MPCPYGGGGVACCAVMVHDMTIRPERAGEALAPVSVLPAGLCESLISPGTN